MFGCVIISVFVSEYVSSIGIVFRVSCFAYRVSRIVFRISCLIYRVSCLIFRAPVCLCICGYMCVFVSLYICVYLSVNVYVYMSLCLCVCLLMYKSLWLYLCIYCLCSYLSLFMYMCVYLSLFLFICVFLYVCVCIYDSMCLICIWVNVSNYLFSYVSNSLYGGNFNKPANIMNFIFLYMLSKRTMYTPGAGRSRSRMVQEQGNPGADRVIQELLMECKTHKPIFKLYFAAKRSVQLSG